MPTLVSRVVIGLGAVAVLTGAAACQADEPRPPAGFRALFNGRDLTGWYGLNPHNLTGLTGDKKDAKLAEERQEFPKHWRIENGELVNDGHGPYATTEVELGDIELLIDYKTVPMADSGIYLRGLPQVQIWDWNQPYDLKNPTRKPHLGSGGLFNNTPGTSGRDPSVKADRPFGEWNQFRIRQVGDRTWVWLNGQLVVDDAPLENYSAPGQAIPEKGPIHLQTHGGEIRWRNIFVRDIGPAEGRQILAAADLEKKARLAQGLTLHASFDQGLEADFSRGDRQCYLQGSQLVAAVPNEEVQLVPAGGRFGGGLHFTKKGNTRPAYRDAGAIGYNDRRWSTSVSVWLKLNPDLDLEPGYCDPVQIVGDDLKKGFIFLEWSKDETPRFFRYAVRPLFHIWNPDNVQWADIPFAKRPMVQVEKAPFTRENWTHVVFSLDGVNDRSRPQVGRLHINGKLQGTIENWDFTFGWDPEKVLVVLGAAYVGYLDDLAVFDHALSDGEIRVLHGLTRGAAELR
ncbi:MAG: DUF1080 domain-containing protein [Planctomycetes bacterium]|nr:DUF1080 domain-containing protein [Planctomycetota bacterium]